MDPNFRAALAAEEPTDPPEKPATEEPEKPATEEPAEQGDAGFEDSPEEAPGTQQGAPDAAAEAAKKAEAAIGGQKKVWRGKFKEKNDKGEEVEQEVELAEEEIARIVAKRRSLDRAAFQWSEKAKQLEKERAEEAAQQAADPWAHFKKLGQDPLQAALGLVKQVVDFSNLPEDQKAQLQLQQERLQLESQRQQFEDEKNGIARAETKKQYQERLVRELPAAMDKRGLVKHPLVMSLLNDIGTAHMMATKADFPDLEWAAEETEAVLQEAAVAWLGNLAEKNPGALAKALPPNVLKAVQAAALASTTRSPTRPAVIGTSRSAPRDGAGKPRGETKPTYQTPQEWRQRMIAEARGEKP